MKDKIKSSLFNNFFFIHGQCQKPYRVLNDPPLSPSCLNYLRRKKIWRILCTMVRMVYNVYHVIPPQEFYMSLRKMTVLTVKEWFSAVITNKGLKSCR